MAQQPASADVFPLVARRRRAVAGWLETLDEAQLATPSLCAGWNVRTVAAHLAEAAAPGPLATFLWVLRAGGNLHRANDLSARRAARRPVPEIAALLRQRADSRFTPPMTGPRAPLTEVLVHEGDMRLPLGLPHDPEPESVRPALQFVTTGRPIGFVSPGTLRGLALAATDLDWSASDGAMVRGRGIDLLLAACGRPTVLPRLEGPGVRVLRRRLGAAGADGSRAARG